MGKSNKPFSENPFPDSCLIDTDVLINWLTQEVDPNTKKELWKAPHQLIKLIEDKKIKGFISLFTLLEVRFVLRRKKDLSEEEIKKDINKILRILEVIIPGEIDLLRANELQIENPLSPFDALLLSVCSTLKDGVLITRDKSLLKIASKFINSFTPEDFLSNKLKK